MKIKALVEHVCQMYYSFSTRSGEKDMQYGVNLVELKKILDVDRITSSRINEIINTFLAYGIIVTFTDPINKFNSNTLVKFNIDYKTLVVNFKESVFPKGLPGEPKKQISLMAGDIVKIRKGLQLTQENFAKILGLSLRNIQDWEQGHRLPNTTAAVLLRVAERTPEVVAHVNGITNWKDLQSEKPK